MPDKLPAILECPANYFGKGEEYTLPEDPDVIREFERRFQEWELAHPDDPLGELALARAKQHHEPTKKTTPPPVNQPHQQINPQPLPQSSLPLTDVGDDMIELELTLPADYVKLLKNYAKFKRRRPRDIIMSWIQQFCRL